jgi:hypothetical protein
MLFSQRIGKKPVVKIIQREEMDEELRNSLWNALTVIYWKFYQRPRSSAWSLVAGSNLEDIINSLWLDYFKKPLDKIPWEWEDCLSEIRN